MTWAHYATVYRSPTHDRTWIGVVEDTDQASTQAGPLRAVKAAVEGMAPPEATAVRWRRTDADGWEADCRWETDEDSERRERGTPLYWQEVGPTGDRIGG